jgi:hypothetical protein
MWTKRIDVMESTEGRWGSRVESEAVIAAKTADRSLVGWAATKGGVRMLGLGGMSVWDIIKKFAAARKIVSGKVDGVQMKDVSGTVTLVGVKVKIAAKGKLEGSDMTMEGVRKILGEEAVVKVDGTAQEKPDIDVIPDVSGLKIVIKYLLQYEEGGEPHEIRLYAFVKPLG